MGLFDTLRKATEAINNTPEGNALFKELKEQTTRVMTDGLGVDLGGNLHQDVEQSVPETRYNELGADPVSQETGNMEDAMDFYNHIMEVYPEPGHNEYECDEQAENEGLIEVLEYGLREDATNCYEEDLMPFVVRFDNADHAKAYVKKCIGSSDYTIQRDPAGRPIYTLPNNDNQMFYRRGNILLETLGDYDHREYEILKRELLKLSQW